METEGTAMDKFCLHLPANVSLNMTSDRGELSKLPELCCIDVETTLLHPDSV